MKKSHIAQKIFVVSGLLGVLGCNINIKIPTEVKDAFTLKFPEAKTVFWEQETDVEWEAEFTMNDMEYSANFMEDGTWKETEHKIELQSVPKTVLTSLMKAFPDYKIKKTEIAETSEGSNFEFEIEKGGIIMDVMINNEGVILKKEIADHED
ncbi:hypothetical protein GCM10011344_20770 [Dokdonia pacifica]|uniref:Putative beta-lactamase-inhibitor-like, PepSY-like n=1 Tax=Dokdonia pacifica TaxID=1627892 RepID=A0A238VMD5_9FLAO|nr:PepSY-like domain-containing protein [Dokdonia pacifica]GGG19990.1 hypothetical protein GCM10011344_20770 [Dokdonia pacifica]SNR35542.1 Putative beta-lactamase-inhibitor-like, PepSY-like [Dokdonia pacifica]